MTGVLTLLTIAVFLAGFAAPYDCCAHKENMYQHEKLAVSILARDGIATIWKLEVAAAGAHDQATPRSADVIRELAEAAEAAWLETKEGLRDPLAGVIASLD